MLDFAFIFVNTVDGEPADLSLLRFCDGEEVLDQSINQLDYKLSLGICLDSSLGLSQD